MRINIKLSLLIILVTVFSSSSYAQLWVKTYDGSTTGGKTGTITLDDWGFVGPQGRQADSFEPYGGVFGNGSYDSMGAEYCMANPALCGIGQMQHVITSGPDGITPDAPEFIKDDFLPDTGDFENVNVDSLTTFYLWGYTSPAGSTFSNMLIDFDGDYKIAKDDMVFEWYNTLDYKQVIAEGETRIGDKPDSDPSAEPPIVYNNTLAFQPYAVSDAKGWCGSVIASHPNAHEAMAGQVMFDIIMDVYTRAADGSLTFFSSELTPDFEMRSFGDIEVNFSDSGQFMNARAVVNNTDASVPNQSVLPSTPVGDLSWHNRVSFMGANILPSTNWCGIESAEWVAGARGVGVKHYDTVRRDITTQSVCEALPGGKWDNNSFSGFAYILRADANRYIDYFDESEYGPDPMTLDTDTDGVLDFMDNCSMVANAGQQDTDGDNFGNACDGDFNGDNIVNSLDIGLFKSMFFTSGDVEADLNSDGIVNVLDLGLFKTLFFSAPGPSGTAQ
jgi:hypothetical protein